jgi:hypothetical protein
MRATSGLGPATPRQALSKSMRPTASMRGRPSISQDSPASCRSMATAPMRNSLNTVTVFCWSHVSSKPTPSTVYLIADVKVLTMDGCLHTRPRGNVALAQAGPGALGDQDLNQGGMHAGLTNTCRKCQYRILTRYDFRVANRTDERYLG